MEEYVEEVLASPKEYQPKTEQGKRVKRDALKEPVKIAERREKRDILDVICLSH